MDRKQEIGKELSRIRGDIYNLSIAQRKLNEELGELIAPDLTSKYAEKCFRVTVRLNDKDNDDEVFYIRIMGINGHRIDYLRLSGFYDGHPVLVRRQDDEEDTMGNEQKEISLEEFSGQVAKILGI